MPWDKTNYPDSMKNLPAAVRNKAIEIANAMLGEKSMQDGIAIATGISRAKDWAANRGKKTENREKSKTTDVKRHGQDRYVIPYENHWAIKVEGHKTVEAKFDSKSEAVKKARQEAKNANASLTIQLKTGKVQQRISYNPNNTGRRASAT
ncbi:DUF2188 domain-containing protein [Flavobacterium sp.]|uniref:DUF2188 domain-containing protein n=1 Tax=Flavobacterium sp. TaxID=239 RepID=UPI0012124425|nr:DUF2188 domain-containing protein [Flavobacterium sp.]RZJ71827.1 MAG: DUF2188 domain-containing protein [Flavobacterium sp.]